MDKSATQLKVQHCPECRVINEAGTWGESCHTLPGEACRQAGNSKHCYTLKTVLSRQESADAVVAKKFL